LDLKVCRRTSSTCGLISTLAHKPRADITRALASSASLCHFPQLISANIVSTFQAGAFGGALLGFPLMESVGRRLALIVATGVFIIGAILQTVATTQLSYIYAGRALVGLGVGGITCAAPAMLAEISVPAVRGQLVGLYEIAYQVGAVVGVRPSS
jgi:MFS family permease